MPSLVATNIVIVGGGIAGLAAAIYLAREGRAVTIFERRRDLGGRAVTHLRKGFRFNLGPHALYRGGSAARVYRELGIPIRGGRPSGAGLALLNGSHYRLPAGVLSLLLTTALTPRAKAEAAALMFRIRRADPSRYAAMTVRQWLDDSVRDPQLRLIVEAFVRLTTYSAAGSAERRSGRRSAEDRPARGGLCR